MLFISVAFCLVGKVRNYPVGFPVTATHVLVGEHEHVSAYACALLVASGFRDKYYTKHCI